MLAGLFAAWALVVAWLVFILIAGRMVGLLVREVARDVRNV